MKKILFACAIILSFAACKKNKTEEPAPIPIAALPKVKIFTLGGDPVNYAFDAQGRIISRVNPISNWKYEFSYGSNTVTENYFVGTTLSTVKEYELNANGLVTKETYTAPTASVPYKSVYTYNGNRQVQTKVSSNTINTNTTTETYFYTGTVLDSMQTTFNNNSNLYRFFYNYYTDKVNSLSNKNQGFLFLAEAEEMPLRKQTSIFKTNGFFNTQVDDYTYNFDTQNRITKRTIITAGGGGTSINDITYY